MVPGEIRSIPEHRVKEICPRGNNKVVIYISLYHDKCFIIHARIVLIENLVHV